MRITRFSLVLAVATLVVFAAPAQTTSTNSPPHVQIVAPTNGTVFTAPADVFILANAIDRDGEVVSVSFYANQHYIGGVTNPPPDASPLPPWRITWEDVPPGFYYLQARAQDNARGISWSMPVRIEVRGTNPPPPPPTNYPPHVRITSPLSGATFREGSDIRIDAVTVDRDGYAPMIEFFANGEKIGEEAIHFVQAPDDGTPIRFEFVWTNVLAGTYTLTAKGTDDEGAMALSDPLRILVGTNPPPQTNLTVVTIEAPDPTATEHDPRLDSLPDNARLVVRRHGPTNLPLNVEYSVRGSASNGVDYVALDGKVTIPAGERSASIIIEAIDDAQVETTETVVITLQPPACLAIFPPPPDCYAVGRPGSATAYIRDNDAPPPPPPTNYPPHVRITYPSSGATFREGSNIRIGAVTIDRDGYAPTVEFFANGEKIGERSIHFVQPPADGTPIQFELVWSNVVAGAYVLTAKGTDDESAMGVSDPVRILVGTNQPPPPPPTNVVISIAAIDAYASEGPWTNSWTWRTNDFHDTNIVVSWPWHTNIVRTNTAAFVIRRAGRTNDPVTVKYHIGGTASNGVDYAELSGEVTIPAGVRGARILVVPLEDGLVEGIETVVLELAPPAGDPPPYHLGFPVRAAAVITDNDSPRPRCIRLSDGMFHLCLPGVDGDPIRIEASHDLVHWFTICTNVISDGAIHFVDPDADGLPCRFYRAVPDDSPSGD